MEAFYAILIGILFAGGIYGILRRSMVRVIVGIILLSQSINLLVFFSGGANRGKPAIMDGETAPSFSTMADPLPQALVLTAIVIGFGLIAFVIVLFQRVFSRLQTDDTQELFKTDS
ncbi:MAG: NADH-quinone oxidoreductase subunit K [Opitutales bacterium]|nr:NADH-quinone oxidoreductase subunit K [Opitutales bacterium]